MIENDADARIKLEELSAMTGSIWERLGEIVTEARSIAEHSEQRGAE